MKNPVNPAFVPQNPAFMSPWPEQRRRTLQDGKWAKRSGAMVKKGGELRSKEASVWIGLSYREGGYPGVWEIHSGWTDYPEENTGFRIARTRK